MAWADTVQENIQHRVGLQAAPLPHAETCHKVLASFQPWEQKILLRHFAGGYMSGSEKDSWSREHYAACPLCGQRDTKAHRMSWSRATAFTGAPAMSALAAYDLRFLAGAGRASAIAVAGPASAPPGARRTCRPSPLPLYRWQRYACQNTFGPPRHLGRHPGGSHHVCRHR